MTEAKRGASAAPEKPYKKLRLRADVVLGGRRGLASLL